MEFALYTILGIMIVFFFMAILFIVHYVSDMKLFKKKFNTLEREIISTHDEVNVVEKMIEDKITQPTSTKILLKD